MKVAIACDHAGLSLKNEIKMLLQNQGHQVIDFGADSEESSELPDYIYPAALAVSKGKVDRGIFIDGYGHGSALIANKITDLYAAVCHDPLCAKLARSHSNTNILCLGAKIIGSAIAAEVVNTWVTTEFLSHEEKYKKHVERVIRISETHLKPLFRCEIEKHEKHINNVITQSISV